MPTEGATTARPAEESAAVDGPSELPAPSKKGVVRRAVKEFRSDNLDDPRRSIRPTTRCCPWCPD